jgi:hypothetical protein
MTLLTFNHLKLGAVKKSLIDLKFQQVILGTVGGYQSAVNVPLFPDSSDNLCCNCTWSTGISWASTHWLNPVTSFWSSRDCGQGQVLKILVIYEAGMGSPLLSSGSKKISIFMLPKFQECFRFTFLLRAVCNTTTDSVLKLNLAAATVPPFCTICHCVGLQSSIIFRLPVILMAFIIHNVTLFC